MDGLAGVQARIATIEGRFTPPPPAQEARGAAPQTASSPMHSVASPTPSTANFQAIYSSALVSSAPPTPALRLQPGQYGRLQPPAELLALGNGRVPPARLATIGHGDHRLHGPAALAFQRMEQAAGAEGVSFGVIASYRDLPSQQRIAQEKGLYSEGGLAAVPGTSNHGWGLSVDLDLDPRAQDWMSQNGWRFGFVEDVPREPWHWTYRPAQ